MLTFEVSWFNQVDGKRVLTGAYADQMEAVRVARGLAVRNYREVKIEKCDREELLGWNHSVARSFKVNDWVVTTEIPAGRIGFIVRESPNHKGWFGVMINKKEEIVFQESLRPATATEIYLASGEQPSNMRDA